jgi:alkylated DNA repair dioxygenase AlkB
MSETIRESSEPETLKVENDLPPKNVETLYSNFPPVWEKLRCLNEEESRFNFLQIKGKLPFKRTRLHTSHGYKYSSTENPSEGWPQELQKLMDLAKEVIGCAEEFDSALVNYYPDGHHYVSDHNDKDAFEGFIALFSFGAKRTFRVRSIATKKILQEYNLENGSLFVMKPGMQ